MRTKKKIKPREGILETERLIISPWQKYDEYLGYIIWGNPIISGYLTQCAFTKEEIDQKIEEQKESYRKYKTCLFPMFLKENNHFIGVCGVYPHENQYKFVILLLPNNWHRGYGQEAGKVIIDYVFNVLHIPCLVAGHHPNDEYSEYVYEKLGFVRMRNHFWKPTNKVHYGYVLNNEKL